MMLQLLSMSLRFGILPPRSWFLLARLNGDGANLTISFAGELLQNAEELIRMGLHPSVTISGYSKAINKVSPYLPTLCFNNSLVHWMNFQTCYSDFLFLPSILDELVEEGSEKMDVIRNKEQVISRMKSAVASKLFGRGDILCPLIADVINLLFFAYCLLVFYELFILIF